MLANIVSKDRPQPTRGVNLHDPGHELQDGEIIRSQNLYWDGFTTIIPGSTRRTPSTLNASKRIRGGHKFYPSSGTAKRLVAYGTTISVIDDAGGESILTSTTTDDVDTHFSTWSITSRAYAANGSDNLYF